LGFLVGGELANASDRTPRRAWRRSALEKSREFRWWVLSHGRDARAVVTTAVRNETNAFSTVTGSRAGCPRLPFRHCWALERAAGQPATGWFVASIRGTRFRARPGREFGAALPSRGNAPSSVWAASAASVATIVAVIRTVGSFGASAMTRSFGLRPRVAR